MTTAEVPFGNISFASRKRSRRPQFPKAPVYRGTNYTPPPDDGILGLTRTQALGILSGGIVGMVGIAAAIFKPWENLRESEKLDPKVIENARMEMFKLDTYTANLRQKMVNFWLQGEPKAVEYTTRDNQTYYFSFDRAKEDPKLTDMAKTTVTLERRILSTGGNSLVFTLAGTYNPLLEQSSPPLIKSSLKAMNFEHEAIASIALITGLISAGKDLGLDFKPNSRVEPQEPHKLAQLGKYIPVLSGYAEALAETSDYILTYPFFDKNPQGKIVFVSYQGYQDPLIGGRAFLEGGLTFIVDQNIGASIKGLANFDQLAQRYPTLESIPGSPEYLRQIQQHFQTKP